MMWNCHDENELRNTLTSTNVNQFCKRIAQDLTYCRHSFVRHVISLGLDVNGVFFEDDTLLHVSTRFGDSSNTKTKLILDAGANIEWRHFNWTPLSYSIKHGSRQTTYLLLDNGAKLSNVDPSIKVPSYVYKFLKSRKQCCTIVITILGLHKCRRTTLSINNHDVITLIAKMIYETRLEWLKF